VNERIEYLFLNVNRNILGFSNFSRIMDRTIILVYFLRSAQSVIRHSRTFLLNVHRKVVANETINYCIFYGILDTFKIVYICWQTTFFMCDERYCWTYFILFFSLATLQVLNFWRRFKPFTYLHSIELINQPKLSLK
jgi:hypothetical protein